MRGRNLPSSQLSSQWASTFDATCVITVPGRERQVARLLGSLPFDPGLVSIDVAPAGVDCRRGTAETNHHIIVGERHKRIVADAASRGLGNVCVFEDDAEMVMGGDEDKRALVRGLEWARTRADRWDVLYLGYLAPWLTGCAWVSRSIVRPARPLFAHALVYNRSVFGRVMNVDLRSDHRPALHRWLERAAGMRNERHAYFREGVASLDTWLSYADIRRRAVHPIAAIQHQLPPGTAESWRRRTGRTYDVYRTPRQQASVALAWHYSVRMAGGAGAAALAWAALAR
jgi:hypothetical protein